MESFTTFNFQLYVITMKSELLKIVMQGLVVLTSNKAKGAVK